MKALTYISKSGYSRGKKINSFNEFARRLDKRLPFYWRHKFMAAGFIEHWSIVQIRNAIKYGNLVCAEKNINLTGEGNGSSSGKKEQ